MKHFKTTVDQNPAYKFYKHCTNRQYNMENDIIRHWTELITREKKMFFCRNLKTRKELAGVQMFIPQSFCSH